VYIVLSEKTLVNYQIIISRWTLIASKIGGNLVPVYIYIYIYYIQSYNSLQPTLSVNNVQNVSATVNRNTIGERFALYTYIV